MILHAVYVVVHVYVFVHAVLCLLLVEVVFILY